MNPYDPRHQASLVGQKPTAPKGLTYIDPRTGGPANVPAFGGIARSGSRRLSADPVFDARGELNAYDHADAIRQIGHILDSMKTGELQGSPVFDKTASAGGVQLTAQERDQLIIEAVSDPHGEGFAVLGQQLVNPVKEVLDYEGFSRRCLPIRLVRQGEVVRYDKDVFTVAFNVGRDAQTPEVRVGGHYIWPTPRDVSTLVTIELRDVYQAGYDILARIQDRSRQAIEKSEDDIFIGQLDRAATLANDVTFFTTANLATLEAIRRQVEKNRIPADKLLVNRDEVTDFITVLSTEVDPITQRELVMGGFVGMCLNMSILTSAGRNTFEVVQPGNIYCVTAPEFLGGFPIWVELFSEPVNQFHDGKPVRGWFWYELISMIIINAAGVAKGVKAA